MKKQLFGLMTILTILGACQKNEVSVELSETVTIHATIEDNDATKTVMDESNNILWSENDQIIAFMKSSYGHKYQVISSFIGKSYADFSMVSSGSGSNLSVGNAWDHNVVYYPFSENIECLKSGANYALEVNLPSEQVYVPDSFANGSMAMVAVSESNNITFKNVLGGIKLQLKGTQKVKSIKIEGKNNEKLSGTATVMAYTDENKPAITMASNAATSVTLNCGTGVQLNESSATEFIIALPPILFSEGFTITLNDVNDTEFVLDTKVANAILRSSILIMPEINLNKEQDNNNETYIESIFLNKSSLTMFPSTTCALELDFMPLDAAYQTITWSSSNNAVAAVDQTGKITAISNGTAVITALAIGGANNKCTVQVVSGTAIAKIDYIDEYEVNHGKGIAIGGSVWAPVNCGFKAPNGDDKGYPYGKLYQWGRKFGQGYDENDASYPSGDNLINGPVKPSLGSSDIYKDVFFINKTNWCETHIKTLWYDNGKQSTDPCPTGWRVPTEKELDYLIQNHSEWAIDKNSHYGYYFSGEYDRIPGVPEIFLPAAGWFDRDGIGKYRNSYGYYWSSTYWNETVNEIQFSKSSVYDNVANWPVYGYSVRCVQE